MSDGSGPKRSRVTLKFEAGPLALPGEANTEDPDLSLELQMPTEEELAEAERAASLDRAGGPARAGGRDGWERERRSVTPPPMAAYRPSTVPPPLLPPADNDALALVDHRSRPSIKAADPVTEMSDRFALDDFTAALRIAELILGADPEHVLALETASACREKLARLYTSRLGPTTSVPRRAVAAENVRWLGLDHRAGFLLAQVDGEQSIEEIVDVSGMQRLEVLKTLVELLEMQAIGIP